MYNVNLKNIQKWIIEVDTSCMQIEHNLRVQYMLIQNLFCSWNNDLAILLTEDKQVLMIGLCCHRR